jgi:major membrane immunogen (membrane-anchored lipoprotein)
MTKTILIGVLMSSLFLVGCASFNTSLDKNEDGTYTMTRTSAGFLRWYGSVYNCTAEDASMQCKRIDKE